MQSKIGEQEAGRRRPAETRRPQEEALVDRGPCSFTQSCFLYSLGCWGPIRQMLLFSGDTQLSGPATATANPAKGSLPSLAIIRGSQRKPEGQQWVSVCRSIK